MARALGGTGIKIERWAALVGLVLAIGGAFVQGHDRIADGERRISILEDRLGAMRAAQAEAISRVERNAEAALQGREKLADAVAELGRTYAVLASQIERALEAVGDGSGTRRRRR